LYVSKNCRKKKQLPNCRKFARSGHPGWNDHPVTSNSSAIRRNSWLSSKRDPWFQLLPAASQTMQFGAYLHMYICTFVCMHCLQRFTAVIN
jgi:hypothetical protein